MIKKKAGKAPASVPACPSPFGGWTLLPLYFGNCLFPYSLYYGIIFI